MKRRLQVNSPLGQEDLVTTNRRPAVDRRDDNGEESHFERTSKITGT
jgi:hypothetical protein